MKKLILVLSITLLFFSCRKSEIEPLFSTSPEERASERLAELQNTLVGGTNGFKGVLTTSLGGGYSFYMKFKDDNTLEMLSDINTTSSTTVKVSTYRTKWLMDASLIFDTYNYISLLQDPGVKVPNSGGTSGNGLQSDVEFEYLNSSQDSVFFTGKRYGNKFVLTKLNASQEADYLQKFQPILTDIKAKISELQNPYVVIPGITNNVAFNINQTAKTILIQYIDTDGKINGITAKFGFDTEGLTIPNFVQIGNSIFKNVVFEQNKLYLVDLEGNKIELKSNTIPILPMKEVFAYNGVYKNIYIGSSQPAGIASGFNMVYAAAVNKFAIMNPSRTLVDVKFTLVNSTTATVTTRNNNGSTTFIAVASYNYSIVDGMITLTNPLYDGNWTARVGQLIDIQNYFLSGPFKLDYVVSTDPSVTNIGALYRVDDPSSLFYGNLQ